MREDKRKDQRSIQEGLPTITADRFKQAPVSLGLVAFLVLIIGGAFAGWAAIEGAAQRAVQLHGKLDLDVAHPTLKKYFVTRSELSQQLVELRSLLIVACPKRTTP